MCRIQTLLSIAFFGLSGLTWAQGSASSSTALKDKEAVVFDEIERGFFFSVAAGPYFVVNPPAQADTPRPFSPGQMAQVGLGLDLGQVLSLELFASGSANRAGSDYIGRSSGGRASGDFSTFVPGAAVRVSLLGFADSQETMRTWLYVRGGAGWVMFFPQEFLPGSDVLVFGGPGIEYYTRLRHFSLGLEVVGTFLVGSGTFGFAVTPNLRYAF